MSPKISKSQWKNNLLQTFFLKYPVSTKHLRSVRHQRHVFSGVRWLLRREEIGEVPPLLKTKAKVPEEICVTPQ